MAYAAGSFKSSDLSEVENKVLLLSGSQTNLFTNQTESVRSEKSLLNLEGGLEASVNC